MARMVKNKLAQVRREEKEEVARDLRDEFKTGKEYYIVNVALKSNGRHYAINWADIVLSNIWFRMKIIDII